MLDRSLELESDTANDEFLWIDPLTEFWAHCSNMEVWAEHDYDSRLLHSNLSFPLLKKLTELGDPIAKKRFKEEIGTRYFSGVESVRTFLEEEGYLEHLNKDEMRSFIRSGVDVLDELEEILGQELYITTIDSIFFPVFVKGGEIVGLRLASLNLKNLPSCIQNLKHLEKLDLLDNQLEELPNWIGELKTLKRLDTYKNKLTKLPKAISKLKSLKYLNLGSNKLDKLPESIGNLTSLKELVLYENCIESLPESIGCLKDLEIILIQQNLLNQIPHSIGNLKTLKTLNLSDNPISALPRSMINMSSLEKLQIQKTNINVNKDLFKKLKEKKVKIYF